MSDKIIISFLSFSDNMALGKQFHNKLILIKLKLTLVNKDTSACLMIEVEIDALTLHSILWLIWLLFHKYIDVIPGFIRCAGSMSNLPCKVETQYVDTSIHPFAKTV